MITHAAGESSPGNIPEGTFAIVLGAKDETSLCTLREQLIAKHVPFSGITEDMNPYNGQLMSIGIIPMLRSVGRKLFSSYPLYRGPTRVSSSS
jgi:hypothetical protein